MMITTDIEQWEWFWYQLCRSFQEVFFGHRPCPRFPQRVQQHTRIYDYWPYADKRPRGDSRGLIYSYWLGPIWMGITQMHSWSCTKKLCWQSACPYRQSCISMMRSYCDSISKWQLRAAKPLPHEIQKQLSSHLWQFQLDHHAQYAETI